MKSTKLLILSLFFTAITAFIACNSEGEKDRVAVNNLKAYVDSVHNTTAVYTKDKWTEISKEYQDKSSQINEENLSEEQKKELATAQKKYDDLKVKYEAEITKKEAEMNSEITSKTKLRNELFGEGKVGNDMSFSWVTASNILSVYTTFVDVVDRNKKIYSREDWDEVKVLYEALDTRKNEVEKELASKDNAKIAKEKVKIASIFAIRRPLAKADENADAKK